MDKITFTIDGQTVSVEPGTTILEAARSLGIEIPTLCYHKELTPNGICRLCVVDVEKSRLLVPSCSRAAEPGMVVHTRTPRVEAARRTVLELLMSSTDVSKAPAILHYAEEYGAKADRFAEARRRDFPVFKDNPFYVRDYSKCIVCRRCTLVCSEVVGASAIEIAGRGYDAHVSTPFQGPMIDSSCVFCGSCVTLCPTEALVPVSLYDRPRDGIVKTARTICGYCGVGCALEVYVQDGKVVEMKGFPEAPVNGEMLCVKGRFGWDYLQSPDRLTKPLIRRDVAQRLGIAARSTRQAVKKTGDPRDDFLEVGWDVALDVVADQLAATVQRHGPDAVAGLASARCTNEENYLFQKLMRVSIGTNNVDHCARL